MPTYLALLRGINVSGKKIIKMEDLRHLMKSVGYTNVKTYIQSGNVIFGSTTHSKEKVAASVEALIEGYYGFDVAVFIFDAKDVEKAVDNNPFVSQREPEGAGSKKLYLTFLSETPSPENRPKLLEAPIGDDLIEIVGDVVYFKLQAKASESKLSNNLIESKLKLRATTRNWNVTLKLLELLQVNSK
ncbi:hypothetical protein CHU92_12375 [Flavobacterium cyanobacteriorum]|uniref:DUF1697 domain-containing protein n=1 Tax=Flavobacterium cyanobacteriorum TaxID=2022802 RepID=A0A255YXR0_9FLAO|nr:DUF1697 domain-containing protein [Flavobacterium cyanobacteriorum]OYQ33951.1 hypothetical protein CHU92_12375 [Flavobacterium cyanobacteriorum]